MLNFTVGPVQMSDSVRRVGGEPVPYFRTKEFSQVMLENEAFMKKFAGAGDEAKAIFLTASGTGAMEAAVMNLFSTQDRVLVVNGGSFGERFVKLCEVHGIPFTEIRPGFGEPLYAERLAAYKNAGYTGFLVNVNETSTGVRYDMDVISRFCQEQHLSLVVDAISSFIADPLDMKRSGVDAMITSSQKALACPPGISIVLLSERAVKRAEDAKVDTMYFNLKASLDNGRRGQTPFTPAVGILRQIHTRLAEIDKVGLEKERARIAALAQNFREGIKGLPFEITSRSLSNAVTPLHPLHVSAYRVFTVLKDQYGIWVCPNGGRLADYLFRVGHIGNLTLQDNRILLDALEDMNRKGLLN